MARADRKKVVLSVDRVSKSFRLPTEQSSGIKQAFVNWSKGVKGYKEQSVLRISSKCLPITSAQGRQMIFSAAALY